MQRLVIGILGLAIAGSVWASTFSTDDINKLEKAQQLAARVYKETKDAAGAVNVLEEGGVRRLIKARPDGLDKRRYTSFLETYAGYLSKVPDRRTEAARLLKRVIETDSSRASGYLRLGNLYSQWYRETSNPRYRSIYQGAYKKYIQRMRDTDKSLLLDSSIVEAVYPVGQNGVCGLVKGLMSENTLSDIDQFFNPERNIKLLNKDSEELRGLGSSFAGFVQHSKGAIRRSSVDIDNDGKSETRYTVQAAINGCRRNLFYQEVGGRKALLSNQLLDQFFHADRVCGDSRFAVMRYQSRNYIVEYQSGSTDPLRLSVFDLSSSGRHSLLCTVKPVTELQKNLVQVCPAAVCQKVADSIDRIVTSEGRQGAEWLVSDINSLVFAKSVKEDALLKPFISSQHQYLADLDNDGDKELIARFWAVGADGQTHYQHRLFKQDIEQRWELWQLPAISPVDAAPSLDNSQWFFVKEFEGQNHLVSYKSIVNSVDEAAKPAESGSEPGRKYDLQIYLLNENGLNHLGSINTFK